MASLKDHLCFLIGVADRKIAKFYNRKLAPYGLTVQHFFILLYLLEERDGVKSKDLQKTVILDSASLTGHIDRMERAGFIERKPDPIDRRAIRIYLTKKGKDMETIIKTIGEELKETLQAGVPQDKIKLFKMALDMISSRLN